jgi:uncharacterized protein YndB with AHSA1/START domain
MSNVSSKHLITIAAPPPRIVNAFFDPVGLSVWWQAKRSVTTPRVLGPYVIEWEPTEFRDDVLGPLGGVFHGTIVDFKPGHEFFVANAYWLPPDGEPIGPMGLEVSCEFQPAGPDRDTDPRAIGSLLKVTQSGFEEGERWRRYYDVIASGWSRALESLKVYLERHGGRPDSPPHR